MRFPAGIMVGSLLMCGFGFGIVDWGKNKLGKKGSSSIRRDQLRQGDRHLEAIVHGLVITLDVGVQSNRWTNGYKRSPLSSWSQFEANFWAVMGTPLHVIQTVPDTAWQYGAVPQECGPLTPTDDAHGDRRRRIQEKQRSGGSFKAFTSSSCDNFSWRESS